MLDRCVAVGALLALLWIPAVAPATSVRAVTVAEMLEASELVFEGRATRRRVEQRGEPGKRQQPWTCIQFDVLDVVKGTAPGSRLELCFLGGRIGDTGLLVGEMQYPPVGEHGIYFVENLLRNQLNPLFGWTQGHFRVVDGVTCTADGRPVLAVARPQPVRPDLSTGTAQGLDVGAEVGAHGLSPADFKRRLSELRQEAGR